MSLDTWKAAFYREDAWAAASDDVTALLHSLRKWVGLRIEHLVPHHVFSCTGDVLSNHVNGRFCIDSSTCALCARHFRPARARGCSSCPLKKHRGVRCDAKEPGATRSPFSEWSIDHNPEPMIALIEAALRNQLGIVATVDATSEVTAEKAAPASSGGQ